MPLLCAAMQSDWAPWVDVGDGSGDAVYDSSPVVPYDESQTTPLVPQSPDPDIEFRPRGAAGGVTEARHAPEAPSEAGPAAASVPAAVDGDGSPQSEPAGSTGKSSDFFPPPLPPMWDSRMKELTGDVRIISSVKNQASCNSCVSFAVIAAAETAYALGRRISAAWVDFSEHSLFFCDSALAASPPNCNYGWNVPDALAALQRSGVYLDCCREYNPTLGSSKCESPARPGSCRAGRQVTDCRPHPGRWEVREVLWGSAAAANVSAAKELVMSAGSAVACFREFSDTKRIGREIYRDNPAAVSRGYHCAQLIGWDDEAGYWLFKSSWGEDLGDNGFYRDIFAFNPRAISHSRRLPPEHLRVLCARHITGVGVIPKGISPGGIARVTIIIAAAPQPTNDVMHSIQFA
ncbi:hypothetical protein VOLCADRAFT_98250 [Volvox carteri f. nagariensis]|uniref:Peptidase C1A papain C-terminal domain-containing protein n=1 Tax=Volvox carteri f. nagariensis TaxID=3068 RepID=D8UEY6_VOLCA|nr:uncharacterized protein VOLCADRAFT_98250 [Volvox carteri f. nagariensis]EFJ41675.1 hypothetical protein VOLCADRAFT_98250 [Volvox carteri f. nagariensis]|eukprot:XP_002957177.1 hypothetical protein VOLCADRAFT_98250 [Volvox carteri f. nagariensis]